MEYHAEQAPNRLRQDRTLTPKECGHCGRFHAHHVCAKCSEAICCDCWWASKENDSKCG